MRFTVSRRDYKLEWRDGQWMLWRSNAHSLTPIGTVRETDRGWWFRDLRGRGRDRIERPTFSELMDLAL